VRSALTVTVLVGLFALSAGVAFWAWREIGDVDISPNGLIALGLGAGATFALGAGLMALVFFSNRRGYDDRAHRPNDLAPTLKRPNPDDRPAPPERR
jgi:hypothetical protein